MLYAVLVVQDIDVLIMFSVDNDDKEKLIDCYDDPTELLHIVSVNLLTLSKVTADDYLMTQGDIFHVQRPSDYRFIPIGIFRMYYGFNRHQTLQNIKQLYFSAKHLLENVQLSTEERAKLRDLVKVSHKGIKKLQITYIKDTSVYSELQIILDETKRGIYVLDIITPHQVHIAV